MIMQTLISMPGGAEWILIILFVIPWFLGIRAVLINELADLPRIAFTILAVLVPPFAIMYLIYSMIKKPKEAK